MKTPSKLLKTQGSITCGFKRSQLIVGAPPVRLERMIHFVPPHNEKIRAKIKDIAGSVDVVLGNLEDAIPADQKEAARRGFIAMARDSTGRVNGSQFYITYTPQPRLDAQGFTVFGKVVAGAEVLQAITPRNACAPGQKPTADNPCQESPPPGDEILGIDIEES